VSGYVTTVFLITAMGLWASHSPDLIPLDLFAWGFISSWVEKKINNI
jgi:hypothetical protein